MAEHRRSISFKNTEFNSPNVNLDTFLEEKASKLENEGPTFSKPSHLSHLRLILNGGLRSPSPAGNYKMAADMRLYPNDEGLFSLAVPGNLSLSSTMGSEVIQWVENIYLVGDVGLI